MRGRGRKKWGGRWERKKRVRWGREREGGGVEREMGKKGEESGTWEAGESEVGREEGEIG